MAKRYTDSLKYKKPFIRSLPGAYKLLWDFLYHDCDHAGIWIVDFEISQSYIGKDMPVDRETALRLFNSDEVRIVEVDNGKKWFIPSFIEFQYGQLMEKNRAHLSAILQLKKYGLLNPDLSIKKQNKGVTSPFQVAKDKDMDKELDMDKEKGVQGEKFTDHWFTDIFDKAYLTGVKNTFKQLDVDNELKIFQLKVRGSPADYGHRDTGSIRQAFLYQLKNSHGKRNGHKETDRTVDAIIPGGKDFGIKKAVPRNRTDPG